MYENSKKKLTKTINLFLKNVRTESSRNIITSTSFCPQYVKLRNVLSILIN